MVIPNECVYSSVLLLNTDTASEDFANVNYWLYSSIINNRYVTVFCVAGALEY